MKYLEQMCPNPQQPANGQIGQGENKVGSQRPVQCSAGYQLRGSSVIHCLPSGRWTNAGECYKSEFSFAFLNEL